MTNWYKNYNYFICSTCVLYTSTANKVIIIFPKYKPNMCFNVTIDEDRMIFEKIRVSFYGFPNP